MRRKKLVSPVKKSSPSLAKVSATEPDLGVALESSPSVVEAEEEAIMAAIIVEVIAAEAMVVAIMVEVIAAEAMVAAIIVEVIAVEAMVVAIAAEGILNLILPTPINLLEQKVGRIEVMEVLLKMLNTRVGG